jgi:hypothetical protein
VKLIPRIYKHYAETLMLYTWVTAQRKLIPAMTVEQAVWSYFSHTGIDDWDIESAVVTYSKLQKEFYEDCQS